jgi:hypothetical protein
VTKGVGEYCPDVDGAMEDLEVGEAEGAEAGTDVQLVAFEVGGLLGGGAVVAEGVGLDDEVVGWVEEVDAVFAEALLGGREREISGADEGEETALERGLGAAEGLGVEDALEAAAAGALRMGIEESTETVRRDEVPAVGVVDRVFDLFVGETGGEIDEDRERVADWDAVDEAALEGLAPVEPNPRPPMHGPTGDRDLDRPLVSRADPPQLGPTAMAQLGSCSAGENGRHQFAVAPKFGPADRVDAPMNFVEAPAF